MIALTDAEVLALPLQHNRPFDPPAYRDHAEERGIGRTWLLWLGVAPRVTSHTAPGAIAARQRRVIAAYLRRHPGAAAAAVSAAVILPVWTVERRLAELAAMGEGKGS